MARRYHFALTESQVDAAMTVQNPTPARPRRKCSGLVRFKDEKRIGPGFKGACWICGETLAYDSNAHRVEHREAA